MVIALNGLTDGDSFWMVICAVICADARVVLCLLVATMKKLPTTQLKFNPSLQVVSGTTKQLEDVGGQKNRSSATIHSGCPASAVDVCYFVSMVQLLLSRTTLGLQINY